MFQLSIEVEDVGQLLFRVFVHNVGCRQPGPFVHSHVKRSVEAEREAAAFVVEVVARNAKVGQQAVNFLHSIVAHPLLDIPEVAADKGESVIVDHVLLSIGILVEAVEVAVEPQASQDLAAVSAAAESHVHIDTVRPDSQAVNAFCQKHWYVVCLCRDNHLSQSISAEGFAAAMMSSSALPNSSLPICVSSTFSFDHISMVSPIPMNLMFCWMSAIAR